jgi:hypothetical protein
MKDFLKKISKDKIKINLNKNPIKMELFKSFLTVEVTRSKEHLGCHTGWTLLKGENNLNIGGGVVNRVEYLNSIEYKKNLNNEYNNFVNVFYLFEILNNEGQQFFLEYYAHEIKSIILNAKTDTKLAIKKAEEAKENENQILTFWNKQALISANTN